MMQKGTSEPARTQGRTAQRANILAAKIVAETVKSTLGPKGMDKLLIDQNNNVIITNDGATILEEMAVEHPIARMIVEIAQSQEEQVGDGTTTAVILAGELLKAAEDLLEKKVHPTIIIKGYRLALAKALASIDAFAESVSQLTPQLLEQIVQTALTGKSAELDKEKIAKVLVQATTCIEKIQTDSVKVYQNPSQGSLTISSQQGLVIQKPIVHPSMHQTVANPKIALLQCSLELKETETESRIQISSPNQIQQYLEQEEQMIRQMVEKIASSGATFVFCSKGIDDHAQYLLAQHSISACRRVSLSDMQRLASCTQAKIITRIDEIGPDKLGTCGIITSAIIQDEPSVKIINTPQKINSFVIVGASTVQVTQELSRAVDDALGDLRCILQSKKIVGGAASLEVSVAKDLRAYAAQLSGKEQLAVEACAKAYDSIGYILAENAGLDPIEALTRLQAGQKSTHWIGLDVITNQLINTKEAGIIEPIQVKQHAISAAVEVATLILRIDDIIFCGPVDEPKEAENESVK